MKPVPSYNQTSSNMDFRNYLSRDETLEPLPKNWEMAYTDTGMIYFIEWVTQLLGGDKCWWLRSGKLPLSPLFFSCCFYFFMKFTVFLLLHSLLIVLNVARSVQFPLCRKSLWFHLQSQFVCSKFCISQIQSWLSIAKWHMTWKPPLCQISLKFETLFSFSSLLVFLGWEWMFQNTNSPDESPG